MTGELWAREDTEESSQETLQVLWKTYINILMKTTQTYSEPDFIFGVNLHLELP
jgi:hypothetical protein